MILFILDFQNADEGNTDGDKDGEEVNGKDDNADNDVCWKALNFIIYTILTW